MPPIRNPPCASAREPRDAHHGSPGNTTSMFAEQPEVDRTWEEGEEAAARERMKRRKAGGEGSEAEKKEEESEEDQHATYASEDPARTHRRGRSVGSSQLTDCRPTWPDTIHVKRRRPVPMCLRLPADWLRSGLLSGPSRSANGTAATKPFTYTRSRSCKSRWEEVRSTFTEDTARRTRHFSRRQPRFESREKKKTFPRPLQDAPIVPPLFPSCLTSCRYSSLTFYIRIEVSLTGIHGTRTQGTRRTRSKVQRWR